MPSSIARREKLIGTRHLALIGVLFVVSFYFLLPKKNDLTINEADLQMPNAPAIGELDLAYLKASSGTGQPSLAATSTAVTALVRTGQIDTARQLLEQSPDVASDVKLRFTLDMELATAEYFAADSEEQRELKARQLLNRIELLLTNPRIRTVPHLEKAAQLSAELNQIDTSVSLYELLAETDADNARHWFVKCAQGRSLQKNYTQATHCYDKAIAATKSKDDIFELRLNLLAQLSLANNVPRQNELVTLLTTHKPLSNSQREKLAIALLADQRPQDAYLILEQLAEHDELNRAKWLLEAARWAQASNQNMPAVEYLKQAAELETGSKRNDLLKQIDKILIASGKNNIAFDRIVERIQNSPNDVTLLRDAVFRANQLGKTDQAKRWNKRLLDIDPADVETVGMQINLALADQDLTEAAKWSKHAVGLSPEDKSARLKWAQVAEWSGDPAAAQTEWAWLSERFPGKDNFSQLIRLATLNRDTGIAASTMRKLLLLSPGDNQNITRMVDLYELEGLPGKAADVLNEIQSKTGGSSYAQRTLAKLHQRHKSYTKALDAWNVYATKYGRNSEETLNRMDLHWRLNRPDESATIAKHLIGTSHASEANDFQVSVISEIAWRYRIPELAKLVKPHIAKIRSKERSATLGKRFVQSLEDAGNYDEAIVESTKLWRTTGSDDVALTTMNLAYKTGYTNRVQPFLDVNEETTELHKKPDFWNMAASIHQKNGDTGSAISAFAKTLKIEPDNTAAVNGLLWSYIDTNDVDAIATTIERYKDVAETEPDLWSAFAVAHLHLGLPELSLTWFDRQLDRIDADYNMLLTFADALEYAGRAEPARKVRLYAIKKLRPVLAEGTIEDQDELVRQYASLLNRYGSAEDKETLAQAMLKDAESNPISGQFWREDIAISWLMSTERHEHARLVMAKIHARRLRAPAWQELSLAMAANNLAQIQHVLSSSGSVSIGNHILALRQLGYDQQAYTLARNTKNRAPTLSDRTIARGQYSAMRGERPSFSSGRYKQTNMTGLSINESGFMVRHSFHSRNIGLSVDYKKQQFSSNTFNLDDSDARDDIAVTLHHGDRRFGGELTAGYDTNDTYGHAYALSKHYLRSADGHKTLSASLGYNEPSTSSALFRLKAIENRLSIGYEQALGQRDYVKLQANVKDINTRVQQKRIVRGLGARIEFGVRGAFGSNVWSTNISASREQNDMVSNLPAEIASSAASTSAVLEKESTAVLLGASLSRGGVSGDYPQSSSPRYYLNANIGHAWPQETVNAQIDAGAGIRIMGGDELSIGFTHESQPLDQISSNDGSTSIGLKYRYHF